MDADKVERLRNMLEVAADLGIAIFQNGKPATVQDILSVQMVYEDYNYVPEFIVKSESGDIKEIWYGNIDSTKIKRG